MCFEGGKWLRNVRTSNGKWAFYVHRNDGGIVTSISIYGLSFSLSLFLYTHFPFAARIDAFGDVTYALVGDHSKHFSIDSISGTITVQNSTFLDRERQSEATFSIVAADKAPISSRRSAIVPVRVAHNVQQIAQINSHFPPVPLTFLFFVLFSVALVPEQVHVTIGDVNDNSPIFTQKFYRVAVAENAQLNPPAAVLQVNALDADDGIYGDVKYAVVANDNSLFQLDPNSGILYPSQSLKGKQGQYKISVEARDGLGFGPNADQAEIVIDVQSINNYRPIFIMPALSNASVEIQEVSADVSQFTIYCP